jgi:tripartite-type tricarboxylate transporter receptor subunit TctC
MKDLKTVSVLSANSILVGVPVNSPFKSLKDVVEYGKKNPSKPITAAVATTAGSVDVVMKGLGKRAGINITPIPHQGGGQAAVTLAGGQTDIGGGNPGELANFIKSGRIRPLAVCFPDRDPIVPDVPTFKEQGVDLSTWGVLRGFAVPAETPKEVVKYYEDTFKKISEDAEFKKIMTDLWNPVIYKDSEGFAKILKETYDDFGKLIKELDIKLESK